MSEIQPNFIRANKTKLCTTIPRDPNFTKRQKKFRLTKTLKDDVPDSLVHSNSSVKISDKLLNVRRSKKRMTQLEKNIDLPDTLLGFNEFKQIKIPKDTHVTKKLRSSSLNPDLPDVLEPVYEIKSSQMRKPYMVQEESKNQEINVINNINVIKVEEEKCNKEPENSEEKKEDEINEKNNDKEEEKIEENKEKENMENIELKENNNKIEENKEHVEENNNINDMEEKEEKP